jgi:hypothetical protein
MGPKSDACFVHRILSFCKCSDFGVELRGNVVRQRTLGGTRALVREPFNAVNLIGKAFRLVARGIGIVAALLTDVIGLVVVVGEAGRSQLAAGGIRQPERARISETGDATLTGCAMQYAAICERGVVQPKTRSISASGP